MLFKNVLRSISRRKAQFISLIVLVFLSVVLFVVFNTTSTVLDNATNNYLNEQKVENFIFTPILNSKDSSLDSISEKYGFTYEVRQEKRIDFKQDGKDFVVLAATPNEHISKPYLQKGRLPENDQEITLEETFANTNNIVIGENYKVDGVDFKVVGFAYISDYLYPVFNPSELVYDYKTQTVAYMTS